MIAIDATRILSFAVQLRDVPKEMQKDLRRNILDASDVIVQRARSNASWSSRIPNAISARVRFGTGSAVQIVVDSKQAPHARPYEGIGQGRGNTFRHPLFGNTDIWVEQQQRPFLFPARRQHEHEVVKGVQDAINSAFSSLG